MTPDQQYIVDMTGILCGTLIVLIVIAVLTYAWWVRAGYRH